MALWSLTETGAKSVYSGDSSTVFNSIQTKQYVHKRHPTAGKGTKIPNPHLDKELDAIRQSVVLRQMTPAIEWLPR